MIQDIDTVSLVKRYPLGMRYALDDRVFRYARAGGTLHNKYLAKTAVFQHIFQAPLAADSLIGSRTISITVGAADGMLRTFPAAVPDGSIAADELADGYLCAQTRVDQPTRGYLVQRKILRNTATPVGGGLMVITVDKPLSYNLIAGVAAYVDCTQSPYANIQTGNAPADAAFPAAYCGVVGAPTMAALINEYLWIQTWGPYVAQADLAVGVIGVGTNRAVVAGPDGNLHPIVAGDAFNSTQSQRVGYVLMNLNRPGGAPGRGAPFIFLQLAP